MATVGMISLGCAKNQVNAEQMMYLLQQAGYSVTGETDGADVVVINTCGFIDSAKSEAIANILQTAAQKEAGRVGKIVVTGCLSERYQAQIRQEMPEVDGVLGCGSYFDIVDAVQAVLQGENVERYGNIDAPIPEVDRVLTTPPHFAYLKIAEGCAQPVQLLRDSVAARALPFAEDGGPSGRGKKTGSRWCPRADCGGTGHQPVWGGPVRRKAAAGAGTETV